MSSSLLLAICIVGGNLALDENEWRDAAVDTYYKFTKSFEHHYFDIFEDLNYDEGEGLIPNGPTAKKGGMPILKKITSSYFGFLELLYSSPDVAVTRHVAYNKHPDGTVKKLKGFLLLVQEKGEVNVEMGAYN